MIRPTHSIIPVIILLVFTLFLYGCRRHSSVWEKMDKAERLLSEAPDSSLHILEEIPSADIKGEKEKARYAILKTIALDKNYIDTTSFEIIQPAVDYYLKKGNADEKLRVLYYKGRIYMNRSDFQSAMHCYLEASNIHDQYTDTLLFAHLLVAQGSLYAQSYQMEEFMLNNLQAAKLYEKQKKDYFHLSSLIKALDGAIVLKEKDKADSILKVVAPLLQNVPALHEKVVAEKLYYSVVFDSLPCIQSIVDTIKDYNQIDNEMKLNVSLGFLSLHNPQKADSIFNLIDSTSIITSSYNYLLIKSEIQIARKNYQEAVQSLTEYHTAVEEENTKIYSHKITIAEDNHNAEKKHILSLRQKDHMIFGILCIILILLFIIGIIYYNFRLGKKDKIITEQIQKRLQLENQGLEQRNTMLSLEKQNMELELERKRLASENMELRIEYLEAEKLRLEKLLENSTFSKPILQSIQERIEILNGLLATKITAREKYSKPYEKWINNVTKDRIKFLKSTRTAFQISHPMFMKYLEDHQLTEEEKDVVCLFAMGLNGKEVGAYVSENRHYHMSSEIRKKLGLATNTTNLNKFIQKILHEL